MFRKTLLMVPSILSISCGMGLKTTVTVDTAYLEPSDEPSLSPTSEPENQPTSEPEDEPTSEPTNQPTSEPSSPTSEPESTSGDGDFVISNITPQFGSTSGGTEVTISGGPFDASAYVDFGGYPAQVISNNGISLVVQTPSFPGEGTSDITINTNDGSQTAFSAFQFFADGTGQTGGIGSVYYITSTGDYWGSTTVELSGANMTFVSPTQFQWWEFNTTSMDTCSNSSYQYPGVFTVYDFGQSSISLSGNAGNMSLLWDTSTNLFATENITSSLSNNTTYSLNAMSGGMAGFSVSNIMRSSQSSIVYTPAISGSTVPSISQYQSFSWSPSGADWIHIRLARLDPISLNYSEEVNCIVLDDGSFIIDGSQWGSWPTTTYDSSGNLVGVQIDVYFTRVIEQISILPHNNSYARIAGEYTLVGGAFAQ
ncbi:MAG: hypothetical protein CL916_06670 [Deltaproteobacteria bacterium]|nr:hypothetical protein [Deltaproteobacteria bacterium]